MWQPKKNRQQTKQQYYSISRKLKKENKTTDEFEVMLGSLPLEDIIALKLELASRVVGGKMYGIPIWHSLPDIVRDAALKYAISASKTKKESTRLLGISLITLRTALKKFKIDNYFENNT